jgi:AraC-like DNA-binding protein
MVSFVVIMRMPVWLNPERWVVWKFLVCTAAELLLMTVCLFASEMVFVQMYGSTLHIAFNPESSLTRNFISMLLMNGIIGIMLGTVVYYYISTADLKRMLMEEESLKKRLMERLRDKMPSLLCNRHIELGNGKDALSLLPEELYYIEAAGNYVEIHYADAAGVMRKHLLRDTISHIETELKDYPDIVRCHRAFIANLRQVEKVTNNRQNIFLKMNSGNALVPVSRSYRKDLKLK